MLKYKSPNFHPPDYGRASSGSERRSRTGRKPTRREGRHTRNLKRCKMCKVTYRIESDVQPGIIAPGFFIAQEELCGDVNCSKRVRHDDTLAFQPFEHFGHYRRQDDEVIGNDENDKRTELENLREQMHTLHKLMEQVQTNTQDTALEINMFADQLIRAVEGRRQELLSEVELLSEQKMTKLQKKKKLIAGTIQNGIYHRHKLLYPEADQEMISDCSEDLDADLYASNDIEESCLRFWADQGYMKAMKSFGAIDECRASATRSQASGLGLQYAVVGEEAEFSLVTKDKTGVPSWVQEDRVQIHAENEHGQDLKLRVINNRDTSYKVVHTPASPGRYSIKIHVNGMEMPGSPFICRVFPKEELTFHPVNANCQPTDGRSPSPTNGFSTSSPACLAPCDCEGPWMLQKGHTSALLKRNGDENTWKIHASGIMNGDAHAWQVRVTTACPKLYMSIGCANRSHVTCDLDDEFYCHFDLSKFLNLDQADNDSYSRSSYSRDKKRSSRHVRKRSTFERSSITFFVVLDRAASLLTVVSNATGEEKSLQLKGDLSQLYPSVSLSHSCKRQNCPRPIVSFV